MTHHLLDVSATLDDLVVLDADRTEDDVRSSASEDSVEEDFEDTELEKTRKSAFELGRRDGQKKSSLLEEEAFPISISFPP